jgi:MerR family transcriptional regulator, glutamine synthetase repressor
MDLNERRQLPLFPIGTVQKLTGLSARQIRYYEQNELISPVRSEGKQRLFSFVDVERLMLIREWLDEGNNIAGVKRNFAKLQKRTAAKKPELSDEEVYKWLQSELMDGPSPRSQSMFSGDLSRFYRKK